jgi:hypothetical protein
MRRAVYITPSPSFSEELESKHVYDEQGNFQPNSLDIACYTSKLFQDLEALSKRSHSKTTTLLKKNSV